MQQDAISARNNLLWLPLQAVNVPDANGNMIAFSSDNAEHGPLPYAGSIIGIGVRHNADLTGGVITWTPTINGVAASGLAVVTEDTVQSIWKAIQADVVNFAAGSRLGIAWTKTGTVAPTTTDVIGGLLVLLKNMDF